MDTYGNIKYTKLAVFDFDNTLISTPLPDSGKIIWREKTGKDWPHKGWWGRAESLDIEIFEHPIRPEVISDYHAEFADLNTMVIMLTGRRPSLAKEVKSILDYHKLTFDAYLYNYGGETSVNKRQQMEKILSEIPSIISIELWDDRKLHVQIFQEWGDVLVKTGRLKDFKINLVSND